VGTDYILKKLPDVSGPDLVEAGRYRLGRGSCEGIVAELWLGRGSCEGIVAELSGALP